MVLKFKNTFIDQRKRQHFKNTEIFFDCCVLLDQSQFSTRLKYFFYKRRNKFLFMTKFKNRCVVSGYRRSVIARFKLSRHALCQKILTGSMPGFYRAIW